METLREAFLHEATRTVDKSGRPTLDGLLYDAGREFPRKKATIRYAPFDMEKVQLRYKGTLRGEIRRARMGESDSTSRTSPEKPEQRGESRVLKTLAEENRKRFEKKLGAYGLRDAPEDDLRVESDEAGEGGEVETDARGLWASPSGVTFRSPNR